MAASARPSSPKARLTISFSTGHGPACSCSSASSCSCCCCCCCCCISAAMANKAPCNFGRVCSLPEGGYSGLAVHRVRKLRFLTKHDCCKLCSGLRCREGECCLTEVGSCCGAKRMLRALTVTILWASACCHDESEGAKRACAECGQP